MTDQKLITFRPEEVEAIRARYCNPELKGKALDNTEFAAYIAMCERYGAHPLRGQIIPTKFWVGTDKNDNSKGYFQVTYITTLDFMLVAAHRTGEFAGMDEPRVNFDEKEPSKYPVFGTACVYRLVQGHVSKFPSGEVYWDEIYGTNTQRYSAMQAKMPRTFMGKCAMAKALRFGFPVECGSLYISGEVQDQVPDDTPQPSGVREVPQQQPVEQPNPDAKPKQRTFGKNDLIAMVVDWSGCHPDEGLSETKKLVAACNMRAKPSDPEYQDFCRRVAEAMDNGINYDDFKGPTEEVHQHPPEHEPNQQQSKSRKPVTTQSEDPFEP
jgi:phage recombination protein Bet